MTKARFVSLIAVAALLCTGAQTALPQSRTTARALPPRTTAGVSSSHYITAKQLTRDQMEQFLLTARIIPGSERPAAKGITHTIRVTLTDGRYYHDGHVQSVDIYKPEFRTKEGVEKNFTDSYKYNIAAYRLDKLMNWGMIPVSVYRVVNGKPSALSWWVDDVMFDEEGRRDKDISPPDLNGWSRAMNDIRDFDQLIYNEDRNQGNLLIDRDWRVWAIDHTRAFRDIPTLRDPSILRRISEKLLNAMQGLNEPSLETNLMPYVTKAQIDALLARRDLLVKFFQTQIQQKGADVVLTDIPRATQRVTIP